MQTTLVIEQLGEKQTLLPSIAGRFHGLGQLAISPERGLLVFCDFDEDIQLRKINLRNESHLAIRQ